MTDETPKSAASRAASEGNRKLWNYHPEVPLGVSPLFKLPIKWPEVGRWFAGGWFPFSERLIILLLSFVAWFFFSPALIRCQIFQFDWIAEIFIRNLVMMGIVAGGLHLYFYVYRVQQDELRYDITPLAQDSRIHSFKNQVYDNMFWTCASGVTVWSAYEVLMMWALANGYAPMISWPAGFLWLPLMIFLIPIWETIYFFLIHRLLHWRPLYRKVHYLHHRNLNVGPWSGLSMHPLEHLLYLGSVMIHWIIPANPFLIIYHLQYFTLSAATTHTGYAGVSIDGRNWLRLGTFHHQMHHRFFECNYGGLEVPFDKWMGSFHDGSAQSQQEFFNRRRAKAQAARS
ncbi:MAG: sterol desaturase family protein [Gammaproteobacteria bacterium]|nr:MAG: sterol desaturase family protein [Gammaproteobacteria bacterium]UCH41661.1 MAG: sterol desaturase family protein [Gammaproteobacteria bacterium]